MRSCLFGLLVPFTIACNSILGNGNNYLLTPDGGAGTSGLSGAGTAGSGSASAGSSNAGSGDSSSESGAAGLGGTVASAGAGGTAGGSPPACSSGDTRCSMLVPETCVDGQWEDAAACAGGCVAGACTPCEPGAKNCSDATAQSCDETGNWVNEQVCSICTDGVCSGSCTPGNLQCAANNVLQKCDGTGTWVTDQTCPFVCVSSTTPASCGGKCKPNTTQCADVYTPQTCDGTGNWQTVACSFACSASTHLCTGVCRPNATEACGACGDGTATCGQTGQWGSCQGGTSPGTYYRDSDGDGYGNPNAAVSNCGLPAGYTTNASDCCDSDVRAFPGQSAWFTVVNGCNSWDYNCSGGNETEYAPLVAPASGSESCTAACGAAPFAFPCWATNQDAVAENQISQGSCQGTVPMVLCSGQAGGACGGSVDIVPISWCPAGGNDCCANGCCEPTNGLTRNTIAQGCH